MVWRRMFLFVFLLLLLAINHGLMRPALNQSGSEIGYTSYGKPIRLPILTLTSFLSGIVHTRFRSFWSLAKQITRNFTNSSFPPLFRPDGSIASTSVDKATIFVKKFASSLDDSRATPPVNLPLSNHVLPNFFLSTRDVQSVLAVLDVRKAHGPDGISEILLKNCSWELAPILSKLFHLILKSNIIPSPWKHAVAQPVSKKGDPQIPQTITLLPSLPSYQRSLNCLSIVNSQTT